VGFFVFVAFSFHLDYIGLYSTVPYFHSTCATQGEIMASAKTATLTFRIEPELKEAVRLASVNEHRSIANMIAVMIRDYCGRVGVEIAEPQPLPIKPKHQPKPRKS
jgi:hypothetical protein